MINDRAAGPALISSLVAFEAELSGSKGTCEAIRLGSSADAEPEQGSVQKNKLLCLAVSRLELTRTQTYE